MRIKTETNLETSPIVTARGSYSCPNDDVFTAIYQFVTAELCTVTVWEHLIAQLQKTLNIFL